MWRRICVDSDHNVHTPRSNGCDRSLCGLSSEAIEPHKSSEIRRSSPDISRTPLFFRNLPFALGSFAVHQNKSRETNQRSDLIYAVPDNTSDTAANEIVHGNGERCNVSFWN
ncbi:hypothetical protein ACJJTC_018564 [Scirpophaga incertulas]